MDAGGDLGKGLRHTDDVDGLVDAGKAGRADIPSGGLRDDIDGAAPANRARANNLTMTLAAVQGVRPMMRLSVLPAMIPPAPARRRLQTATRSTAAAHGNRGDDGDGPDNPRDEGGSGNRDGDG